MSGNSGGALRTNKTFAELNLGEEASIARVVTPNDFIAFVHASGNLNPKQLPAAAAGDDAPAVPSMWIGSLISAVLGNILPGPGTLYLSQTLRFHGRAHVGDVLKISVRVEELRPPETVMLQTRVYHGDRLVVDGLAEVIAPRTPQSADDVALPQLTVQHHLKVEKLIATCRNLPPMLTAVVARENLIIPILIGDAAKIRAVAASRGADLAGVAVEDLPSHDAAAARAVEMVRQGAATAVMKGHHMS